MTRHLSRDRPRHWLLRILRILRASSQVTLRQLQLFYPHSASSQTYSAACFLLRRSAKSSAGYRGLLTLGFASPWFAADAKRLKDLESENNKLKKLLAEKLLENEAMRDVLSKKW